MQHFGDPKVMVYVRKLLLHPRSDVLMPPLVRESLLLRSLR